MVQRVLAAKTLDYGRWGSLFGGALKLSTLFLVVLPGVAAILIFPNLAKPDQVFSHIVFNILPVGLVGIIIGTCLVSILSSIASLYNATSTLLTFDFVRRFKTKMTDQQLIGTGRFITAIVITLSIFISQEIGHFRGNLWQYLQAIMSYFVPPIAAVFLVGFFWKRANSAGAICGLLSGALASFALYLSIEVFQAIHIHFLIAAAVIFAVAVIAISLGSLLAPAKSHLEIEPLMFSMSHWKAETARLRHVTYYRNYRVLGLGLIGLTIALVLLFH